jgi:hypothetical protein
MSGARKGQRAYIPAPVIWVLQKALDLQTLNGENDEYWERVRLCLIGLG